VKTLYQNIGRDLLFKYEKRENIMLSISWIYLDAWQWEYHSFNKYLCFSYFPSHFNKKYFIKSFI